MLEPPLAITAASDMAEPIGPRFAADHGLYDRRYPRQEQSADGLTDRPPLPSLPYLDTEKIKREQYLYSNSIPVTTSLNMNAPPPLISPTTTYSGPPPPYSYPASTVSSSLGGREGHTVPPPPPPPPPPPLNHSYAPPSESRPAYGDDKDRSMHHASRQSLPSIQEALKQDHGITINSLLSPTTTAAPPRTQYITQSPTSPSNTRTFGEVPPRRPPESYPTHDPTNSRPYDSYERTTTTRPTFSPRLSSLTNQSPLTSSKPNDSHPATSMSPSMHSRAKAPSSKPRQPPSPGYPFGNQRSSPPTSSYMPKPGPHPYPYTTSNPAVTAYPGSSIHQSTWRDLALEAKRAEEIRQATIRDSPPGPHRTYGESVKRQLDNFDIETSLNEVGHTPFQGLHRSLLMKVSVDCRRQRPRSQFRSNIRHPRPSDPTIRAGSGIVTQPQRMRRHDATATTGVGFHGQHSRTDCPTTSCSAGAAYLRPTHVLQIGPK